MGSISLFGWNLIIHIMSSLQNARSFPCIRQSWHSVCCHCRQCLMVSLLFFNLCCEEGLPLLHLVWSSVSIDRPLTSSVWLTERRRGRRTPGLYLVRPGCSLVVATETETTCSGKLYFSFFMWWLFTHPIHFSTTYSTYSNLCPAYKHLAVCTHSEGFLQFYIWVLWTLYNALSLRMNCYISQGHIFFCYEPFQSQIASSLKPGRCIKVKWLLIMIAFLDPVPGL